MGAGLCLGALVGCTPPSAPQSQGTAAAPAGSSASHSALLGMTVPGSTGQPPVNADKMAADAQALIISRGLPCAQHEIFALSSGQDTLNRLTADLSARGYTYREVVRYERGRLFSFVPEAGSTAPQVSGLIDAGTLFWCTGP